MKVKKKNEDGLKNMIKFLNLLKETTKSGLTRFPIVKEAKKKGLNASYLLPSLVDLDVVVLLGRSYHWICEKSVDEIAVSILEHQNQIINNYQTKHRTSGSVILKDKRVVDLRCKEFTPSNSNFVRELIEKRNGLADIIMNRLSRMSELSEMKEIDSLLK